ncbi:AMP-binding protein [Desulfothermus naphthae]
MNVYGKLIEAAKRWPNKEAIFSQGRWTTFSKLLDMVERLIAGLHAKGMKEGERLAICFPNSIEYISLLIASMAAGLTVVPLDPTYRRDDLLRVVSQGKIEYLFTYRPMDLPGIKQEIGDLNSLLDHGRKEGVAWEHDRLAMILYTSGTTGTPKGVPYTAFILAPFSSFCIIILGFGLGGGIGNPFSFNRFICSFIPHFAL